MGGLWIVITAAVAFLVTAVLGIVLIPFLRKLKYGQTILEIGPSWHKDKAGTPTMGGLMFVVGISLAVFAGFVYARSRLGTQASAVHFMSSVRVFAGLFMALGYGAVGFMDDYVKVVKKRNLGLTAIQKLFLQIVIAVTYLAVLYFAGDTSTIVVIPFIGQIDLGVLYYPFALFIMVSVVNAVNLTDGIDGLASSVTMVFAIIFMIISMMLSQWGVNIMATALAAGCLGFLVWNFYPAKVFMGDTGSLFLGGMVCAIGFASGLPVFLALVGIVYVMEAGSVVLQVISFKTTGKRIFKMSPIHHHFEMSGYSEVRIVLLFSLMTAVAGAVAVGAIAVL